VKLQLYLARYVDEVESWLYTLLACRETAEMMEMQWSRKERGRVVGDLGPYFRPLGAAFSGRSWRHVDVSVLSCAVEYIRPDMECRHHTPFMGFGTHFLGSRTFY